MSGKVATPVDEMKQWSGNGIGVVVNSFELDFDV